MWRWGPFKTMPEGPFNPMTNETLRDVTNNTTTPEGQTVTPTATPIPPNDGSPMTPPDWVTAISTSTDDIEVHTTEHETHVIISRQWEGHNDAIEALGSVLVGRQRFEDAEALVAAKVQPPAEEVIPKTS